MITKEDMIAKAKSISSDCEHIARIYIKDFAPKMEAASDTTKFAPEFIKTETDKLRAQFTSDCAFYARDIIRALQDIESFVGNCLGVDMASPQFANTCTVLGTLKNPTPATIVNLIAPFTHDGSALEVLASCVGGDWKQFILDQDAGDVSHLHAAVNGVDSFLHDASRNIGTIVKARETVRKHMKKNGVEFEDSESETYVNFRCDAMQLLLNQRRF